ncbi:MAG: hypothetical protein R3246_00565 [Acidimicrobiia bacterium]|nr:hypothetical protein [Acidimicrobiia bacterium]
MSVLVPTAEHLSLPPAPRRRGLLPGLAAVALCWPVVALVSSADPEPPPPRPAIVAPPTAAAGTWQVAPLATDDVRVAALGGVVVAVHPDGIWPVSVLTAGTWQRLLGMPLAVEVAADVGTATTEGFLVAGVGEGRTVLYRYDHRGRFLGARTVFGVEAGVAVSAGSHLVVFDRERPQGVVAGGAGFESPGLIVDAAAVGQLLVVLDDDGVVHRSSDLGETWVELGSGFTELVGSVYAVGASASVGIAQVTAEGLVRLDGAPVGPTVAWGGSPAVYDWSTESVWQLTVEGWERVPLWRSRGFGAGYLSLVDGADAPTVLGQTERGTAVWQITP